jgi:hypothetical protein
MASDDKKTKTSPAPPAPKNETVVKKEAAAEKKDEGQPKDKSTSDADLYKAEGGEKAADAPSGYSRGERQKPVSKAYKDNWNAIYAKKKKKR